MAPNIEPLNSFFCPENVQLLPGSRLHPFRRNGSAEIRWVEEEYLPEGAELLETPIHADIQDYGK